MLFDHQLEKQNRSNIACLFLHYENPNELVLFCVTSQDEMIVLVSYTTTESTIQRICCCKGEKKSTTEPVPDSKRCSLHPPPRPLSLILSQALSLLLGCFFQTVQWPGAIEWQADGPNDWADCVPKRRRQPPSVLLPSFLASGPGPEPTSWEHGAGRLQPTALWEWHNERVHRKSLVTCMWLGRRWCCPCHFGNVHGPMCWRQSCQKSKRRSINLAQHHNLLPNDFWQLKKLPSLCSVLLLFIWCPYEGFWCS